MPLSGKKIALIIIAIQIFALPVILFAAKEKQNTLSEASENSAADSLESDLISEEVGNSSFVSELSTPEIAKETVSDDSVTHRVTNNPQNTAIKKDVYAYVPYWEIEEDTDIYLQYKYMTHFIYHGISLGKNGVINKSNGPWRVWAGERMSRIVANARSNGVKVLPNIVLFNSGGNTALNDFLDNAEARNKAVTQIVNFLKTSPQPVDGVAIDFEYPGTAQKEETTDFMKKLRAAMKAENPNWFLTTAVSGYSYSGGGTDLVAIAPHVDSFFVMSYHLVNVSSSERAGSTNPIGALRRLSDNYLAKIPGDKVVLGFPLYLAEWKTEDGSLHSRRRASSGSGNTTGISDCGLSGLTCTRLAQRFMSTYGRKYDTRDQAAYYSFYDCVGTKKGWKQVYFDDERAFTAKFEMVNNKGLRGVGFWAQNYDKGYMDTWKAIYNAFGDKNTLAAPSKKPGFVNPPSIALNGCTPPSGSVTVTNTPKPTEPKITNIPTDMPVTSPLPGQTVLRLNSVKLHGIGKGGDNTNPNIEGNMNPIRKNRQIEIEFYDNSAKLITTYRGNVTYKSSSGDFYGDITLDNKISSGNYLVKIKSPGYLKELLEGVIEIKNQEINTINQAALIAGDINNDGIISVSDYEILSGCYSDLVSPKNCDDTKKSKADLTDDGKVNQNDHTLFLRELSVQQGD